jgi:5-methylcytosine-specific restriction endonuclease McrA
MIILKERKEFSDETILQAWMSAGGQCEICGKKLVWENRGRENGEGCWEAHHKDGNSKNNKDDNCQILCWDCHKETFGEDKKVKVTSHKTIKLGKRISE